MDHDCQSLLIGNGNCNGFNNVAKCHFDGGDCCSQDVHKDKFCYGEWCNCREECEYKFNYNINNRAMFL